MKTHFQKILSLFLAVVLSVSLIAVGTPSASATGVGAAVATAVGKEVVSFGVGAVVDAAVKYVKGLVTEEEVEVTFGQYWTIGFTGDLSNVIFCSLSTLQDAVFYLNYSGIQCEQRYVPEGGFYYIVCTNGEIYDKAGGGRFCDAINGAAFCLQTGKVLVAMADDGGANDGAVSERKDQWFPNTTAVNSKRVSVVSHDALSNLALTLNQTDRTCSVRTTYVNKQYFYIIIDESNNIYCNADGIPYVAHAEASVTDEKFNYIVNEGDNIDNSTTIDNSQVIDMSNGTFNYIDESGKQEFFVDELVYDFSSQSYSADTYNVTYDNDVYNTYNYTWNITYNITNTYVTNIGQTELYEPLELYYELPDGRSSADLTAEEVAGMSFEFADCVNYAKSATDTYLRALYHFDGNTDDSSYFSTQGKFEWLSGASISYMDVGTFDGALYLGPESHSMKITLPSNISTVDFTVQFRYYQAGEADTQSNIENTLSIGGTAVLKWDEASLYNGSGTVLTSLAIGTWQELAVMRHNGTLYLYHNGIKVGSSANTSAWNGEIVLSFGSTSRAYSMLDELRVINFSAAENGSAYTCTSVPYDTNAVLVLPDSAFPIADEYWNITSSKTNFFEYTIDDFTSGIRSSYISSNSKQYSAAPYFYHNSTYYDVSYAPGYTRVSCVASTEPVNSWGLLTTIYFRELSAPYPMDGYEGACLVSPKSSYVFSIVLSDGTVCSLPFTTSSASTTTNVEQVFDWGILRYREYYYDSDKGVLCNLYIRPNVGSYVDIMYMELVEGSSTDLTAEWVTCMYSSEEVKPNTAAIQTDIPINGYTVGGVRPTFPVRGDVWMPVTGNRISAVYVYNGSAWESVNARWYTGTRWIPIYAFDITTLEDCWDIADIDNVVVQIGTESEFWNWWKKAWLDFRSWFEKNGTGGGGTTITDESVDNILHDVDIDINVDADTGESLLDDTDFTLFDLGKSVVQGTWKVVKGVVRTGVGGIVGIVTTISHAGDFFDFYQPNSEMFHVVNYGGDDIWN